MSGADRGFAGDFAPNRWRYLAHEIENLCNLRSRVLKKLMNPFKDKGALLFQHRASGEGFFTAVENGVQIEIFRAMSAVFLFFSFLQCRD